MASIIAAELNYESSTSGRKWFARFQYARLAALAMAGCVPMLLWRRPRTPLRLLCIGAFDYLARVQGQRMRKLDRLALAYACDFGALRNDFYDQREFDRRDYRDIRKNLRLLAPEKATQRYIRELRATERARPVIGAGGYAESACVAQYRTQVLLISLFWLQGISSRPLPSHLFKALVNLTGLAQLVDDLLDWRDDWHCRRPTFVTAFFREGTQPSKEAIGRIHSYGNRFRNRLIATSEQHVAAVPLALAGVCMWLLAVVLLKVRFRQ